MCYVGKATKIFIFIVTVLVVLGLVLGFGFMRHGLQKSHKCSGNSCFSPPTVFPNPNSATPGGGAAPISASNQPQNPPDSNLYPPPQNVIPASPPPPNAIPTSPPPPDSIPNPLPPPPPVLPETQSPPPPEPEAVAPSTTPVSPGPMHAQLRSTIRKTI